MDKFEAFEEFEAYQFYDNSRQAGAIDPASGRRKRKTAVSLVTNFDCS
jgi:hypothetical protein